MKNYFTVLLAMLLAMTTAIPTQGQEEAGIILQHRETYFTEVRKLDAKYKEQRSELDAKLLESVKALENHYAEQANLEGVIAVREVLEAIEDPFSDVVMPTRKNTDVLQRTIEQHMQTLRALDTEETKARDELKTKYIAFLERVKQKLTVERKIEEALVIHNEIERLNDELKRVPPPKPAPAKTQPKPTPPAEEKPPAPEGAKFLSEAEVIDQIKTLVGATITFNGRVKTIENDSMNNRSFIATLQGGLKIRFAMPENTEFAKRGANTIIKARQGEDILAAGATLAIQCTVAKGVVHHAMPNSFVTTSIIGSDSPAVRRRFRADCGGPCPPLPPQRYLTTRFCTVCGIERTDTLVYMMSPY